MKLQGKHVFALCALCSVVSCATGPVQLTGTDEPEKSFAFFSGGASVYLSIKALGDPHTQSLMEKIASSFNPVDKERQKRILDKTNRIYAAIYDNGSDQKRFIAMLRGRGYPVVASALGLGLSSDWEKVKDEGWGDYWKSADVNLAVGPEAVIVSNGALRTDGSAAQIPAAYLGFQAGSAISGWLPSPEALNGFLSGLGIPINLPAKEIMFAMRRSGDAGSGGGYETSFRLETQNASIAKALAAMMALAKIGGVGELTFPLHTLFDVFFAATPRVEGSALILDAGTLGDEQIAGLLWFFMLH
jgi:hypothetical protein